jgi:hypothetical protein
MRLSPIKSQSLRGHTYGPGLRLWDDTLAGRSWALAPTSPPLYGPRLRVLAHSVRSEPHTALLRGSQGPARRHTQGIPGPQRRSNSLQRNGVLVGFDGAWTAR